jgi:hypothetical protein
MVRDHIAAESLTSTDRYGRHQTHSSILACLRNRRHVSKDDATISGLVVNGLAPGLQNRMNTGRLDRPGLCAFVR